MIASYRPLILLVIGTLLTSCSTLSTFGIEPTPAETTRALQHLLDESTVRALQKVEAVSEQGVAGILPAEVTPVLGAMRTLGFGSEVDKIDQQIRKASTIALHESQGTITDAIKTLRFKDAVAVVLGGETAATEVMRQALYTSVKSRYSDQLSIQLDRTEAEQYWPAAAGAYNMFTSDKVEDDLADFLAERAVDVLFHAVGREERDLRNNYQRLGDATVDRVFDYYSKQKK